MSKILKYILFRTVIVIITLHAIIPHPHSDEMTEKEHIELHNNSNSLYGIIRITFHESDDESLDNLIVAKYQLIKKTENIIPFSKVATRNAEQKGFEKTTTERIVKRNIDNFTKSFIVKLNGKRGPPFII